jgi:endonuclease-3
MNPQKRHEIFSRLREHIEQPRSELEYSSNFELLISVLLSAQATDVSVNKATAGLYRVANTPEKMLALGEDGVREYIKTIGLFNSKAKNVIATCKILIEQHHSEVPEDRAALEALPGVGRKTANVILNVAFGHPTIAVDTHIFRVSNRTGLAPGKDVLEVEKRLLKFVPEEFKLDAHHWLILHGRYTCIARKPRDEVRQVYLDVWRKLQQKDLLEPMEAIIAEVIEIHPEYHALLEQTEDIRQQEFTPERGQTNPFLHMGMHIALREQAGADRPPGIQAIYHRLVASRGRARDDGMSRTIAMERAAHRRRTRRKRVFRLPEKVVTVRFTSHRIVYKLAP